MRILSAAAVVLSSALLIACDQPMSAVGPTSPAASALSIGPGSGNGSAKTIEVPFKGTFEGLLTISTPTNPPLLPSFIEAGGNATHLGRFTLEIPHVVNPITRIGTGRFEFTAADGDLLTADYVGQATEIAPGVLSTVDTATITGGTGRFANATGSFTGGRTFVLATGAVTGSFAGSIVMQGGNRP